MLLEAMYWKLYIYNKQFRKPFADCILNTLYNVTIIIITINHFTSIKEDIIS